MLAVLGQHGAPRRVSTGQDLIVRDPAIGLARLLDRQHVVPPPPQLLHHGAGEVLISIEEGQRLRLLVLADLPLDLVPVRGDVGPGVDQARGPQARIGVQQVRLAYA
jgi:hypothetical protein